MAWTMTREGRAGRWRSVGIFAVAAVSVSSFLAVAAEAQVKQAFKLAVPEVMKYLQTGTLPNVSQSTLMSEVFSAVRPSLSAPAQEALDKGLVRSVHAPEDLLPAAKALARDLIVDGRPVLKDGVLA